VRKKEALNFHIYVTYREGIDFSIQKELKLFKKRSSFLSSLENPEHFRSSTPSRRCELASVAMLEYNTAAATARKRCTAFERTGRAISAHHAFYFVFI
jgi:hypothetical protein